MTYKTLKIQVFNEKTNQFDYKIIRRLISPISLLPSVSELVQMYDPLAVPYYYFFEIDSSKLYYWPKKIPVRLFEDSKTLLLGIQGTDQVLINHNCTGIGFLVGTYATKLQVSTKNVGRAVWRP